MSTHSSQSILIIDDHPLMLDALKHLLNALIPNIEIVSVFTAEAGLNLIKQNQITNLALVVMDFTLPLLSGHSAIRAFKRVLENTPIIVISGIEDPQIMRQVHHNDVVAYISKSSPPEIICQNIGKALRGELIVAEEATSISHEDTIDLRQKLSQKQVEILMLINKGYSNKQIAEHFQLTEISIKKHITHIFKTLKVHNRVQAMMAIQRLGIFDTHTITPPPFSH